MQNPTAQHVVKEALAMAKHRLSLNPSSEMHHSIVKQLEYLMGFMNGTEHDRPRLRDIIIGHYAVREIDSADPEFSDVLCHAQNIATRLGKGLKADTV